MKWSHLPVAGGIYDQHPSLLEQWDYIFSKRAEHEAAEDARREQEQKRKSNPGTRGGRSRR